MSGIFRWILRLFLGGLLDRMNGQVEAEAQQKEDAGVLTAQTAEDAAKVEIQIVKDEAKVKEQQDAIPAKKEDPFNTGLWNS
jgi:hypothetical protein